MMMHLRCLVWLYVLCMGTLLSGQVITIRVINAKNGHPLSKRHLWVSPVYGKNEQKPSQYDAHLQLKTDGQGEARFVLPDPPPTHLSVVVRLSQWHWRCGCRAFVSTKQVIQEGIVKGQELTRAAAPIMTQPRQISLVARRRPFLEQLLLPLLAPLME